MSELSFEQMFEESSFKRLRTGEAVTGQVIGVPRLIHKGWYCLARLHGSPAS